MLKDKSYFKKSTGDEAGCAPMKGVMTSKNMGKVFFNKWSMDVKVEGENVVRNLDLTTHNHGSIPANTLVWPYIDQVAVSLTHPCVGEMKREQAACKEFAPHKEGGPSPCPPDPVEKPKKNPAAMQYARAMVEDRDGAGECNKARRCMLQPYSKTESGKGGCCNGQTGHHLVEESSFSHFDGSPLYNCRKYDAAKAPSICLEGTNHGAGTHGLMHTMQSASAMQKPVEALATPPTMFNHRATTVKVAQSEAAQAVAETLGCDRDCIEAQLSAYHETQCGMTDPTKIKAIATCKPDEAKVQAAATELRGFGFGTGGGAL
jgi:hypothetical protein